MVAIRTYQDALDYIYSFVDPVRKAAPDPEAAALNLERMRRLLAAAGDPQHGLRAVVVAGTKGKGSTAAMIEAVARAAGMRVGLFTSPHLSSYRERIQVNRVLIDQDEVIALTNLTRPVLDAFDPAPLGRPSVFDVGLLLALRYFAARQVDLAVMEIGLGGRFDSVNVLTPLVSVISSISYDHMAILGRTLREIAWNKAGILKPGAPAVSAPQQPEAAAVVAEEARRVGADLFIAGPEGLARAHGHGPALRPYPMPPVTALRGAFQVENARLALGAALLLRDRGLPLPDAALAEGLAGVNWPGRFELVPGAPPVLIDGAHNGDSAQKLVAAIQAEIPHDQLIVVLGTSRDKDIAAIAAALAPPAAAVVITRSRHNRAMDIDRIAAEVRAHLRGPLLLAPDLPAALDMARGLAGPRDLICVTGSLFVAAEAREALGLAVAD
ncbi:MAG: cyanophycin synthetase [Oscillochloridaceae bacterium]|nr:bifunctional folylpolyglutamate synthase/dihydrofolate synthase [Chloroflexaceae bacterium]MDW8391943.1 cyanophycin synthetase [Oscillochloridaceae bacterium]